MPSGMTRVAWSSRIRIEAAGDAVLRGDPKYLCQDLANLRLGLRTLEKRNRLSLEHRNHGRDRLHLEGLSNLGVGIDIDYREHELTAELGSEFLEQWGELR